MYILLCLALILLIIAVDTILGIMLSIKKKEFDWEYLPEFLFNSILPYLGGTLAISAVPVFAPALKVSGPPEITNIVNTVVSSLDEFIYATTAGVTAAFIKQILNKLGELFGIVVPEDT